MPPLAGITQSNRRIGSEISRDTTEIHWSIEAAEKGGFAHFTLKEIYEQPHAIQEALRGRVAPDGSIHLSELEPIRDKLTNVEKLITVTPDGKPRDVPIREGEILLIPGRCRHSPQRPAGTVGMVVEKVRPLEVNDGFEAMKEAQTHTLSLIKPGADCAASGTIRAES